MAPRATPLAASTGGRRRRPDPLAPYPPGRHRTPPAGHRGRRRASAVSGSWTTGQTTTRRCPAVSEAGPPLFTQGGRVATSAGHRPCSLEAARGLRQHRSRTRSSCAPHELPVHNWQPQAPSRVHAGDAGRSRPDIRPGRQTVADTSMGHRHNLATCPGHQPSGARSFQKHREPAKDRSGRTFGWPVAMSWQGWRCRIPATVVVVHAVWFSSFARVCCR
jgi:hypothetical protein